MFLCSTGSNAGEEREGRGERCREEGISANMKTGGFAFFPGAFRPAGKGSFFFQPFSPAVPAHTAARTQAKCSPLLSTRFSCCTPELKDAFPLLKDAFNHLTFPGQEAYLPAKPETVQGDFFVINTSYGEEEK